MEETRIKLVERYLSEHNGNGPLQEVQNFKWWLKRFPGKKLKAIKQLSVRNYIRFQARQPVNEYLEKFLTRLGRYDEEEVRNYLAWTKTVK